MLRKTVFILGAGFSRYAGMPLVQDLDTEVFAWLDRNKDQDEFIRPFMYPMGCEFPDGKFYAGLNFVGGHHRGFEELLIALQLAVTRYSIVIQTNNVLRRACVRLLWEKQRACDLSDAYCHFAHRVVQSAGAISFNWDLVCELALDKIGRIGGYASSSRIPIIKPHGSINWVNHLQDGRTQNPPGLFPIADGMTISWEPNRPLADPLLLYDDDNLRQVLFPGDPEVPGLEENEAARSDAILLWRAAEDLILRAEEIVFIGYSMPAYDQYASKVLKRSCIGKEIVVCNPCGDVIKSFEKALPGERIVPVPLKFEESPYAQAAKAS